MFKKWKEARELKLSTLRLQYLLLSKAYDFVDGIPDIIELAKKVSTMDPNVLQKEISNTLVNYMKDKDVSVTNVDKVEE